MIVKIAAAIKKMFCVRSFLTYFLTSHKLSAIKAISIELKISNFSIYLLIVASPYFVAFNDIYRIYRRELFRCLNICYLFPFGKNRNALIRLIIDDHTISTPSIPIRSVTKGLPASGCQSNVIPLSVTKWKKK